MRLGTTEWNRAVEMAAVLKYNWPTKLNSPVLIPYGDKAPRQLQIIICNGAHNRPQHRKPLCWGYTTKMTDRGLLFTWTEERSETSLKAIQISRLNRANRATK